MSFMRGAKHSGGFPKNGEMHGDVPGRHSREGWLHVTDHSSVYLQGKQYRDMKEWSRPCAVCGAKFSVFEKAGTIDANSRFSNRTCDAHRNLLPAVEKGYIVWSATAGGMIAGTMCVGAIGAVPVPNEELAELKKELAAAYSVSMDHMQEKGVAVRALETLRKDYDKAMAELHAFKTQYDLQPAMEAAKPAFDGKAALARELEAKNNSKIFPWGVDSP